MEATETVSIMIWRKHNGVLAECSRLLVACVLKKPDERRRWILIIGYRDPSRFPKMNQNDSVPRHPDSGIPRDSQKGMIGIPWDP